MILYVNGNEHSAGAKLVNSYVWANADKAYWALEDRPHPDNLIVSWSSRLASLAKLSLMNDCRSNASITSIIERTNEWIEGRQSSDIFVVIGFPSIAEDESFQQVLTEDEQLTNLGIKHLFFMNHKYKDDIGFKYSLNNNILETSYSEYLHSKNASKVMLSNTYFDSNAHSLWTNYLLSHIVKYNLI